MPHLEQIHSLTDKSLVSLLTYVWYYLPDKDGWISAKYIDGGWVYETTISSPRKWWYIHKGYTCTTNGFEVINGLTYAFDKDGYMYENEEIPAEADSEGIVKIK